MDKNVDRQPIAIKKILIPIDKSEYREKIIAYAIALTKAWGAELTAIHVIDPGRGVPGGRIKEKEKEREEEAKREAETLVLNAIDPLIDKEGVRIKKEVVEGSDSIAKSIINYARENNFNVIVIGTKGMTAVEEFFLGSVANNVIHHAHCPVFAIR
ncbi:MAG: universal stress protein [Candidatus Nitrosopolaris sp.]|jgi:nucleotide-binding universal stress UspA family protein